MRIVCPLFSFLIFGSYSVGVMISCFLSGKFEGEIWAGVGMGMLLMYFTGTKIEQDK